MTDGNPTLQLRTVLAEWAVEAEDDPFVQRGPAAGDDDDDDEEDAVPLTEKERCHIDNMIRGYVADEEDAHLLALLQRESGDLKRLEVAASSLSKRRASDIAAADDDDAGGGEGDADSGGGGEYLAVHASSGNSGSHCSESRLARSGRRCRVESHFQHVVSAAPSQVVRFDYGGSPLWCTHPFPSPTADDTTTPTPTAAAGRARIGSGRDQRGQPTASRTGGQTAAAHCEHCGARREFECQLMPGFFALSPLFPGDGKAGSSSTPASVGTAAAAQLLGDSLDFGVVVVYSCPNSCAAGTRTPYELALVQPPPDIAV